MMRRLFLALSLAPLAACRPGPETRLQANYAALPDECFTDEFADWLLYSEGPLAKTTYLPTWSDPCVQAVAEDIGLDPTSCTDDASDDAMITGCSGRVIDPWLLARLDLGTVDGLEHGIADSHGDYVREPFIEAVRLAAETLGHDEVGPTVYDMVTSAVDGYGLWDDETSPTVEGFIYESDGFPVHVDPAAGTVVITTTDWGNFPMHVGLVHAMAHVWVGDAHDECEDSFYTFQPYYYAVKGEEACDEDWDGAWGFSAGAAMLVYEYGEGSFYWYTFECGSFTVAARCFIIGEPCPMW